MAYTPYDLYLSPFIQSQFPLTYQQDGPNFIAFVRAYMEWLESPGKAINQARLLPSYADVDTTPAAFLLHFKNEYIDSLPQNILANPRLVIKHILNLYRTKGTQRAYELLFRMLYNEDIKIFIPGQYLFKPSDNQWIKTQFLEVSDSPYLDAIVGFRINSTSGTGTAIVESVVQKVVSQKVINIVTLSNVVGNFRYGEQIFSPQVPQLTSNNAPIILGSLSNIIILNGGENFNVGDLVDVFGSGKEGIARISSINSSLTGTVSFTLLNGGNWYSMNPVITIDGDGAGASFQVGGLLNPQEVQIGIDLLSTYEAVAMENGNSGFTLAISNTNGTFSVSDVVQATGNCNIFDVTYIGGSVNQFEVLSNTALNISGLTVTRPDGALITVTGTNAQLLNANLAPGVILKSSITNSLVEINTMLGLEVVTGNGVVQAVNSSQMTVNGSIGYFLPTSTLIDQTHTANCYINNTTRLTDWGFPAISPANMDTPFVELLSFDDLIVGKIAFLSAVNPGLNYTQPPIVTVVEPNILNLQIPDGSGNYYGNDAIVTANVVSAVGIAQAVTMDQSGFGYQPNELLVLRNANNDSTIVGQALVDTQGVMTGYYKNENSFLSDVMKLQDSFYYQIFSYEIQSSEMLSAYMDLVNNLVHPCGIALFGRFVKTDAVDARPSVGFPTQFQQLTV